MTNWNVNEDRTYQMELEVFAKMFQWSNGEDVISSGKITADEFTKLLKEFNAIKEHEKNGYDKENPGSSEKIQLLQKHIDKWFGEGAISLTNLDAYGYTAEAGAKNRMNSLCNNGKPLDQKVYVGTILPSSCN